MTSAPDDQTDLEVPGLTLMVEVSGGEEVPLAVALPPPADADMVLTLLDRMDEALAEENPTSDDATLAALILAMGNALRQAPEWPLEARLDSFQRLVLRVIEDTRERLVSDAD